MLVLVLVLVLVRRQLLLARMPGILRPLLGELRWMISVEHLARRSSAVDPPTHVRGWWRESIVAEVESSGGGVEDGGCGLGRDVLEHLHARVKGLPAVEELRVREEPLGDGPSKRMVVQGVNLDGS